MSTRPLATSLGESGPGPGLPISSRTPRSRSRPCSTDVYIGACTASGTKSSARITLGGASASELPGHDRRAADGGVLVQGAQPPWARADGGAGGGPGQGVLTIERAGPGVNMKSQGLRRGGRVPDGARARRRDEQRIMHTLGNGTRAVRRTHRCAKGERHRHSAAGVLFHRRRPSTVVCAAPARGHDQARLNVSYAAGLPGRAGPPAPAS